jgi:hydrogenase maturation protein HypF
MQRKKIIINGIVQGVGFRPFVYRLAHELNLNGYIVNSSNGVVVELEGDPAVIDQFHNRLLAETPPLATIVQYDVQESQPVGSKEFLIKESESSESSTALIAPDVATCKDCLAEIFDPNDRRYGYPFTNCTNCGPRYTIVEGIPYDRPLTSMKNFPMCVDCQAEYDDPLNRRFHAQPNACPDCGPKLKLHDGINEIEVENPIEKTAELLKEGKILAIRGVGGFHLVVDPYNEQAVITLREKKGRAEKPFALMAADVETVKKHCYLDSNEEKLLVHYSHPIVLLQKSDKRFLPEKIAPYNDYFGFMLAYSPLHHLLLKNNIDCLVMTSANFSEEPIAIKNEEAVERLKDIADYFLLHDREILQRCDDSIVTISAGKKQILRRSRGFVPYPAFISRRKFSPVLAVGGELKNSIGISRDNSVFLSQYIGDLDNPLAYEFFGDSIEHLCSIMEFKPKYIAHDMHPEYLSTKWAMEREHKKIPIQHHHAHMVSAMAENKVIDPSIGIILDGTGYGTDHTIWGGEVLVGDLKKFERFAWLKPIPMPGGTAAIKEPWRMGIAYLLDAFKDEKLPKIPLVINTEDEKILTINQMINTKTNCPLSSGCGRLFDAVSAIVDIKKTINYDAQAAIELEMIAEEVYDVRPITVTIKSEIDLSVVIRAITEKILFNQTKSEISGWFHKTLAEYFIAAAISARNETQINNVVLSGGVYQNRIFFKYMISRLNKENFNVLTHIDLPTNDGGIALGQLIIANTIINS